MFFISISTCNWIDITLVILFWLADSKHFTFKNKNKPKVKTADEFAFLLEKTMILQTKLA